MSIEDRWKYSKGSYQGGMCAGFEESLCLTKSYFRNGTSGSRFKHTRPPLIGQPTSLSERHFRVFVSTLWDETVTYSDSSPSFILYATTKKFTTSSQHAVQR